MSGAHTLDVCLLGLALFLVGRLVWRRTPLPPGPPGWPLIGNLLDLRTVAPYKTLGAMSSTYGPIISLNVLGKQYIILNSFKVTNDLLERKSAITCNRPHFTIAGDLVGWSNATPFLQYGDTHRKHRKLFGQYIRAKSSLEAFYPAGEAEVKRFVIKVLKNPDDLIGHCRRTTASLIWKISHGYTVKDDADPFVDLANSAMRHIPEAMAPGRFLADFFPIVRYLPEWFPGGGFHKHVKRWRHMLREAVNTPYEFVLQQLAEGNAVPSLTSRLLQGGVTAEDEEVLKWTSFGMYLGGADTTPSMLRKSTLLLEMKDFRPWRIVRCSPTHISTQDIIYEGYLIPKGSWLFANIWFVVH
ncbi:Cytochrome P450 [Tylopilus felleus]